jgi:signal transduction histidine kinase
LHRVENAWVAEFQQGFWMGEFYPFRKWVDKICPIIFGMGLDNVGKLRFFTFVEVVDKKRPVLIHARSLAFWFAGGVGALVLLGSLALVVFFQHLTRLEEAVAFEALGRANALFLEQTYLPQSEQMARQLGSVMGAQVDFRAGAGAADGRARRQGERLVVGFPLKGGREVWFSRDIHSLGGRAVWARMDAWLVLGGFWLLALVFSVALGSRVTGPLSRLAAVVPGIGGDAPLEGLPDRGPREILQLAGTLRATHESLLEEREMRKHAERLALLGKMVTSLAHEIRNPISAIRLHAQLLESAAEPDARISAELIVSEAERIESLVSQWLRYAKPNPVVMKWVDLPSLVSAARQVIEPRAAHAGVEIIEEIDPAWASHPVFGDAARLHQVLGNLLLNGVQSMPQGGVLRLRVLPGTLEVEDEGGGFSEAALRHFGEAFYSEREGGMGLGLAVSKEIIEAHGGSMWVENLPRRGAKITICWATNRKEI